MRPGRDTGGEWAPGADGARRLLSMLAHGRDWDPGALYLEGAMALRHHPRTNNIRQWQARLRNRGVEPCTSARMSRQVWRLLPSRRAKIGCGRGRGRRAL